MDSVVPRTMQPNDPAYDGKRRQAKFVLIYLSIYIYIILEVHAGHFPARYGPIKLVGLIQIRKLR